MKVAFFGTPQIAKIVLGKLIDSPFKPLLVITGEDTQQGRGRNIQPSSVKKVALENKIEVLQPANLSDKNFVESFNKFSPDIAILIAYGKMIPNIVLTIPKFGFLNIHPSLLPRYRGPSPITATILYGDKRT